MTTTKPQAMVLASFAADSLALGAHWIYDTNRIDQEFGRVDTFQKPLADSFHPTKDRGDFTHYGDQTLVLLETVATSNGFDLDQFSRNWQAFFKHYDGYLDHATRNTLKNLDDGNIPAIAGSLSADLGGAARIAPLVYVYQNDLDMLIHSTKAQTAMTHNNPDVIQAAVFLCRVAYRVLTGITPQKAIQRVLKECDIQTSVETAVRSGLDSVQAATRPTIKQFGQMCDTAAALPSVVHLIAKYEDDLQQGLVENVLAGGDSAARGLLAGMIIGAHLGVEQIPQDWLAGISAYERICGLIDAIRV
jgi:ADP-ribosylglycohydrolase